MTDFITSLIHGGEHRITSQRTLAISESADTYILRNLESEALHYMDNSNGGIIIDTEECIRPILTLHHLRNHLLCEFTRITLKNVIVVYLHLVKTKGILVAVHPVLHNLKMQRTSAEGNSLATCVDEILCCSESSMIVVDDHSGGINTSTDTVKEHKRHLIVYDTDKVIVLLCILRL